MPYAITSLLEDHGKETLATSTFLSTQNNKSIDLRGIKYKFAKNYIFLLGFQEQTVPYLLVVKTNKYI